MNIREAIVLAGGLGTRLRSAVPDLPKCMAPVNGKPFIAYVIDYFRAQGIEKFIFSLGYMHEVIRQYLDTQYAYPEHEPATAFSYSIEDQPLGTGGAIRLACRLATETTTLVLNGDTLFKVQPSQMAAFHHAHGADCTLALKPMTDFDRYGVVTLGNEGRVTHFKEKQFYHEGLINGGVYALDPARLLAARLPEQFSFEKDWLEQGLLEGNRKIYGIVQDDYFIDIGIPADYERAQAELLPV
ncbi:MAG TPA: nucleotidyltransferase family protein [Chitinophagaceae bacterium]|jgi:D-glycero-alpha-D-manno-heptose 1-phosphate guanylyltransferase